MTKKEAEALARKLNDRMLRLEQGEMRESCPIGIIDFRLWEWAQGVGLYGMWRLYRQTGDPSFRKELEDWYEARLREGVPEKNVNTTAPMLALACLAEETRNPAYAALCEEWAHWVMEEMPRTEKGVLQHIVSGHENKNQVWDDTLFMTVLFLAKWGVVTENRAMQEEAAFQFLAHAQWLCDRKTGLWFHGWHFDGRHHFAEALWARGNCWITIAIPAFLSLMGDRLAPSVKRFLLFVLEDQAEALRAAQRESGLWTTLLDDPDSYEEASAAAGFGCGLLMAVRYGFLPGTYRQTALSALEGIRRCVGEDGALCQVSYGTGISMSLDDYRSVPLVPMAYGQALAVLFLCEYLADCD